MKLSKRIIFVLILSVSASLRFDAQVKPINDQGILGLEQLIREISTTGSVMMIGAHPDDENSEFLPFLARGLHARTAYLSVTRGDGGQNIIGPELFEALGIIRTEEPLQAGRLDGAERLFTRAFDYGFSKSLDEARSKWDEKIVLCDGVRAVRSFRPLVVISRFSGTPNDRHGQHQFAGYISPLVVAAAADPAQCTDAGPAWRVSKFYRENFGSGQQPGLVFDNGQISPILGRSYAQVGIEARSYHRSQGEGRIEFRGSSLAGLNLVGADPAKRDTSIFDGIDTSINGIASLSGNTEPLFIERLGALSAKVTELEAHHDLSDPRSLVQPLTEIYKLAYDAEWSTRKPESKRFLVEVERKTAAAIRIASGLSIDVLSDSETVVPGDQFLVAAKAFLPKDSPVTVSEITLDSPPKWSVSRADAPSQNNAAFSGRESAASAAYFNVKVDPSAELTQPYWLRSARQGDMFVWPATDSRTLAFDPSPVVAHVKLKIGNTELTLDQPVQYRFADPARGEVRRELNIVPALSVSLDRDLLVIPVSDKPQTRRVVVSVTNNSTRERSGNVSLNVAVAPQWKVDSPQGSSFTLKTRGAKASIPFDITIPAKAASSAVPVRASASTGAEGGNANLTMHVVAYPHIQTHRYYTPADMTVRVLDLKTSPVKVGYVMGSGDDVPEAIRQMGYDVTLLTEQDLASGDLARFGTIVVGIRASETRPDLVANNARLLDYAKNGGNVIVQYQRGNWTGLAPFPVNTQDRQGTAAGSIARVVDENAKVTILDPSHPAFNSPNKITDADFAGWVQERNAYNLVTFDPQYTPLLESHDAGEQENKGGLVVAKLGKGNWVYCSYSFFRQLPAGVPGAYRLFANLLSLPKTAK